MTATSAPVTPLDVNPTVRLERQMKISMTASLGHDRARGRSASSAGRAGNSNTTRITDSKHKSISPKYLIPKYDTFFMTSKYQHHYSYNAIIRAFDIGM